jgi:hypothetical protein
MSRLRRLVPRAAPGGPGTSCPFPAIPVPGLPRPRPGAGSGDRRARGIPAARGRPGQRGHGGTGRRAACAPGPLNVRAWRQLECFDPRAQRGLLRLDDAGHVGRPEGGGRQSEPLRRRRAVRRDLAQVGTLPRVLGEAGLDEPANLGGNRAEIRLTVHDAVHHRGRRRARGDAERVGPGGGVGEDGPEREDVARRPGLERLHLLGGHVAQRPDDGAGRGQPGVGDRARDAEVDDPRPVEREQHVGGLEVTVDEVGSVDGAQRLGQARGEPPHGGDGEGPVAGDDVVKGRTRDECSRQPRRVVVDPRRYDRSGVPAADLLRGFHLVAEPSDELRVLAQLPVDDLDRYDPAR